MERNYANNNSREDTMGMYFLARDIVDDCITEFRSKLYKSFEHNGSDRYCVDEFISLLILMCTRKQFKEALSMLLVIFNLLSIDDTDLCELCSDEELNEMFILLFAHNLAEIEYYADDE